MEKSPVIRWLLNDRRTISSDYPSECRIVKRDYHVSLNPGIPFRNRNMKIDDAGHSVHEKMKNQIACPSTL